MSNNKASLILYVAKDKNDTKKYCKGSTTCINMLNVVPEGFATVQDVHVLMDSQELPSWLDGTPILVDTSLNEIYKGSDAIYHLSEVLTRLEMTETFETPKEKANVQQRQPPRSDEMVETSANDGGSIEDVFAIDKDAQARANSASDSKVTSDEVQRLMEERNRLLKPPPNV